MTYKDLADQGIKASPPVCTPYSNYICFISVIVLYLLTLYTCNYYIRQASSDKWNARTLSDIEALVVPSAI